MAIDRKTRKHHQVNALTFKGAITRIAFGGGRAISIYNGSRGGHTRDGHRKVGRRIPPHSGVDNR